MANNNFNDRLHSVVNQKLRGNWAELSRVTKLQSSTLHAIKKGSDPRGNTIHSICQALNIDANWLLTGKGSMDLTDDETDGEEENEDKRIQAMIGLYKQLPERQQNEIFSVAEEKQRLNQFEFELNQLKKRA